MKVLMLGWEFPPFISGGLGTACYGLTKAMNEIGVQVLFVLPRPVDSSFSTHVKLVTPPAVGSSYTTTEHGADTFRMDEFENVMFRTVDVDLSPYARPAPPIRLAEKTVSREASVVAGAVKTATVTLPPAPAGNAAERPTEGFVAGPGAHYAGDLFSEASRYARLAARIALHEQFDVVHAHDWMTFPAGIAAAAVSGKPLVVHVHSTEFDRSGESVNRRIYDIESQGMHAATRVIAVSAFTKNIVIQRYGIAGNRVEVVHNAINSEESPAPRPAPIRRDEKIVLFLGRITMQKGPEYFLAAAKKVLEVMDNVRFVMAGSGDMVRRMIEMAAEMGIGHKVLFTGFLRGGDVQRVYKMADLYVMPSVSEPFGIAPLEALSHDVPVIISKQSGVSEVLTHALKVDFWDINEMANKIVAVLRHPPLHATLKAHGSLEVRQMDWEDSARRCVEVYQAATGHK